MFKYLLTFKSLTYAQRGLNILSRAGIVGDIVRTPKSISSAGCGYGIRISGKDYIKANDLLSAVLIFPERIFSIDRSGKYSEVQHDIS